MTINCPIVGLGASAGGLEALKSFFDKMPVDVGAAFVIIQHLDPKHSSMTAEILARHTKMPVKQIEHGMKVEVNHVYVIPPNAYVTLDGDLFDLGKALPQRGLRMPIDMFFASLAEQHSLRAIGIILSGTGSDGSAGLREIKGSGGAIFVQTPETAQFDGMPQAAIATGQVDVVCPVEDMPAQIVDYLAHDYVKQASAMDAEGLGPDEEAQLNAIIALLQTRLGHDFRGYKKGTLGRRIVRRMGLRSIHKMSDYLTYLNENDKEAGELYRDLLISVTSFFRDPEAFAALDAKVLSKIVDAKTDDEQIRVWVPGCATGEEAYSIAMQLIEKCDAADKRCPIQVFATDLDEEALAIGRTGEYSANLLADISAERLHRFFVKQDGGYRVTKELREAVMFASQNVITDPPFSRLDLISCRNLLIYLEGKLQDRIIGYFHFALREGGYLFLGRSESMSQLTDLFEPIDKKSRLFRRLTSPKFKTTNFPINGPAARVVSSGMLPGARPKETVRLRDLMQQQLLRNYAPAAVLTNAKHQILYFMGPTARYLEQPSGLPTQDLLALVHPELRKSLREGLKQVVESSEPVLIENASTQSGGVRKAVKIAIKPMAAPGESETLFMVTFEDVGTAQAPAAQKMPADQSAVSDLETKLRDAQEDLQISLEELESTNEELQASNEEMMSVNEELQSANEELETSKEELQAMNEELSTVNNQLKDKVEQLADVNDDLTNFVASTGIATVLLDSEHQIGRFTPPAKQLFNLIDADIGRPISDIRQKFADENFLTDVDSVFKKMEPIEREVMAEDGACYLRRVAPCQPSDERAGGVVVTFVDISQRLENERKLRESEARFRSLVENAPDPLIMVDAGGKIILANSEAQRFFGYEQQELLGLNVEALMPKRFRDHHRVLRKNYMDDVRIRPLDSGLELRALLKNGEEVPVEIGLSPVKTADGMLICAAIRDIREHQRAMLAVKEAQEQTEAALKTKSRFLATASHDLRQPLQSLTMMTEALMLKTEDPELISLVSRQSVSLANMRSLLNSLLDISKLDADAIKVEIEDVDLLKTIENICDNFKAEAESKGVKLKINVQDRVVRSDVNLLQRILQNLIGNAIRYTEKGKVEVVSSLAGDQVKVEVRDTGVGMPADQLSHIFDEFFQIDRDPQEGNAGLGLGLSIAQRIAEKLGSHIDVESTVGKGSVFSLMLPLADVLLPKNDAVKADKPAPLVKDGIVLLVDDDAAVLKSTKFRLSLQKGLEIIAATSPKEAGEMLDKIAPKTPDLIVTDYHLGTRRSGIDLIKDTRKRLGKTVPAILVSGDTALNVADMKRDGIDVVFKPTSGNELIEAILRLLGS